MTKRRLQNILGIQLVVSHFLAILMVVVLWLLRFGFDSQNMIDTVSIMAPMFAVYTTAILKQLLSDTPARDGKRLQVSSARVFLSLFIPSVFVTALVLIVIGWVNRRMEFSEFKAALGFCETAFGIYVGIVIHSLFQEEAGIASPLKPVAPGSPEP